MTIFGRIIRILGGLVSVAVIFLAITIGWLIQSKQGPAEGIFFATIFPLLSFKLPATIIGHGRMSGVEPVPEKLMPHERPEHEMFLDLPFGQRMPMNGLGMCCRPTAYDDELVKRTTLWYLMLGGRLIDTAHIYLNHKAVGHGIQEAQERGIAREEIFVTSKHWPRMFGYETTKQLVPTFLKELGVDYIDLLLMHAPAGMLMPSIKSSECSEKKLSNKQCREETWRALDELRQQGLLRNIGVSNFGKHHLQELQEMKLPSPIAVNQITYNPWAPDYQVETFEYCQEQNIAVTAYASLGGFLQKSKAESTVVLSELSESYNKTVAQIMLRWAIQKGAAVIPGTGNPKHMRENLAAYEFEISEDDMKRIAELRNDEEAKKYFYMEPPKE
ncbi:hypothetical protein MPSEU_000064300 [Mayamaea pseudoterrestris]|nr:hypothetical protein MPSEU_000063200 [Mayamaea pseudoterrestris]GKY90915.1 hypothetical protein MPSEU_000064300 [Mayamaea pseudoterrestris]